MTESTRADPKVGFGTRPPDGDGERHTRLEAALRHDRWLVIGALALASGVCWWWIIAMGLDMYGPMTGASAWAMAPVWDGPRLLLLFAMWAAMMTAMMLPSAAPVLLVYGGVARRRSDRAGRVWVRVYALAGGYLAVWAAFSAGATALQRVLASLLVLSPMMELYDRALAGAMLVAAGVYQWTPLKRACLAVCRSPLMFVAERWRPGTGGAFRMGVSHGFYCLGCCWALMLLLFAGGVMNLWVVAALAVFVLVEKIMPFGRLASQVGGAWLAAAGAWLLLG